MRINHNMLALNTHRQLGGVALAQAKSMEKLSSGYRINRAGDDAAGLAISEKMRAQIRGLNTAAKNAQDGISLIQTGEGALQEVHSMLNRMVELATQSANGTYDDKVDRKNLESELNALKSEVNRVAESANFNGIKLLDGSLGSKMRAEVPNVTVHGQTDAVSVVEQKVPGGANGASVEFEALKQNAKADHSGVTSLKYNDASGKEHRIDFEYSNDGDADKSTISIKLDGAEVKSYAKTANKDISDATKLGDFMKEELSKIDQFGDLFTVKNDAGKLTIQAKESGNQARAVELLEGNATGAEIPYLKLQSVHITKETAATAQGPRIEVDTTKMSGVESGKLSQEDLDKAIIIVDGEKFAFVKKDAIENDSVLDALEKQGVKADNIIAVEDAGKGSITDKEVKAMADKINDVLGKGTVEPLPEGLPTNSTTGKTTATPTTLSFSSRQVDKGKGLTLQVGESSEDFQKITVRVNDMSSKGLGIDKISVATQEDAAKAIANIRNAINTVSSSRGDLGALQNRLEHTIANINTTAENITASESRIRDVDMAKEMVELTRANILQQAAQAMLAQANQAPQGVLQLLR